MITKFLTDEDKIGYSVDLMQFFLDTLGQLEVDSRGQCLYYKETYLFICS